MPPTTAYAAIMLAAGIGIPVMAALNAALGQRIGTPLAASLVLFAVAFAVVALLFALTDSPRTLVQLGRVPKHLCLAGGLTAFYVLSITYVAPHFGVGNAVFFVLLGQLISAAAIDHFGLLGAVVSPVSPMRALGIAVMGLGVWLTQQA